MSTLPAARKQNVEQRSRYRRSASLLFPLALLLVLWQGGGGTGGGAAPLAAAPANRKSRTAFPLTLTDDSGRRVTLPAPPRRIISLSPGHTETLFALGAGDRVVAVDTYSDYPPEVTRRTRLKTWPRPPVEQVVALKPDLVLVLTEGEGFTRQMDALKIPTLYLFPKDYARALDEISLLGRVLGEETAAARITGNMRKRAEAVRKRLAGAPQVRVMYEMDATDPARPYVAGGEGFYSELMRMAGGENVFSDLKVTSGAVSAEAVIARDPEVILMGDTRSPQQPQSPELLARRPGWSAIRAVRTRRVYSVDSDRITRPGPRLVDGLEEFARRLHPDRFR